jgi:sugar phosphate permease
VALLFAGYAAYYFCRSDLSVAMPLIIEDLQWHGMSSHDAVIRMGQIASFGVLAYAIGKLFLTGLGDIWDPPGSCRLAHRFPDLLGKQMH